MQHFRAILGKLFIFGPVINVKNCLNDPIARKKFGKVLHMIE